MKNLKRTQSNYPFIILLTALLVVMNSCSEDDLMKDIEDSDPVGQNEPDSDPDPDPDPDPTPDPTGTEDPDANMVSESLIFRNGIKQIGEIPNDPISTNTFNVDRDTIAITNDFEPFIGFSNSAGHVVQIMHTQVEGSDFYFEAEIETDIENDTLIYFNFEFDTTGWELPVSFNLKVVPQDINGAPLDSFILPVLVEAPKNNTSGCNIEEFLFGHNSETYTWVLTSGPNIYEIFGAVQTFSQILNGCCTSSGSFFGNCIGLPTHGIVSADSKFSTKYASLTFNRDGTVSGVLSNKYARQPNQIDTDYCNGVPAYDEDSVDNFYTGTYTFNSSDCSITIDKLEGISDPVMGFDGSVIGEWPRPIHSGFGSGVIYTKRSGHILDAESMNPETSELNYTQTYVTDKTF